MGREQLLQILFIWSLGESRSKNPRKPSIKDIRSGKKKKTIKTILSLSLTQNDFCSYSPDKKKNSMISPPDYVFYTYMHIYAKYLHLMSVIL